MKANDGSGDIPEHDEWETPKELFNKLHKQYHFELDCCANYNNTKTKYFCNNFLDNHVLKTETCWMNPPFSKSKIMFEKFFGVINRGVAIYRCDNLETKIWQDTILPNCDWVFIPKGRIVYEGMTGSGSSRFPSALIGVGVDPPKNIKGALLKTKGKMEIKNV